MEEGIFEAKLAGNAHSQNNETSTRLNQLMTRVCTHDVLTNVEGSKASEDKWNQEAELIEPIYQAKQHDSQFFDPDEYLDGFYKTPKEGCRAMQIVLYFLPGIICRLPPKVGTLLDLGSGPTVYIAIMVRRHVEDVFISDYSKANRDRVISWIKGESAFDWSAVCKGIASIEATAETPEQLQSTARTRVRAVLDVNVHQIPVIRGVQFSDLQTSIPAQFDVVTSMFCLEYASETMDEYRTAVRGAVGLIKAGGHLIQGGVFHAKEYAFGGRRFKCHYLTLDQLLASLHENQMCITESEGFKLISHNDVFLLISRKIN